MKRVIVIFVFLFLGAIGCVKAQERCGIENCHGIDISCGPNVPEICSMMYGMGDFCREYARCEVVQGECRLAKDSTFEACAECVRECTEVYQDNPMEAFGCEAKCRERIKVHTDPGSVLGTNQ
jgi:hypothetical protein